MERRAIAVRGVVQGVGFRPFVYGLATHLELSGFVKNCVGSVLIEVEGDARSLEHFLAELATRPSPLARIDHLAWERRPPPKGIAGSASNRVRLRAQARSLSLRTLPPVPTASRNCSTPPTGGITTPF